MVVLKDVNARVHFPSHLFPANISLPLNTILSVQEKGFCPLMPLLSWAAMGPREARQIGNAIRSPSKGGTLAATDKRGRSPATPGEEGGRNHKHPFSFLHQEAAGGGRAGCDTMAPTLYLRLCHANNSEQ